MRYGRYGYAHLFMRAGLGLTFIWIGIDIFRNPTSWIGFLPSELPLGIAQQTGLFLGGAFDIILGFALLSGRAPKLTSLLAGVHLASIIIYNGIDAVLIRDISLLGTALALFVWPYHRRRKHWWHKSKPAPNHDEEE